jgi:hypothetical protein
MQLVLLYLIGNYPITLQGQQEKPFGGPKSELNSGTGWGDISGFFITILASHASLSTGRRPPNCVIEGGRGLENNLNS